MSVSVADGTYIDRTAVIIGNVEIGAGVSIWPYVVLRGDQDVIQIGEGSNIQDQSVIHVDPQEPAIIGRDVSVGHGAILHGARIDDRCIIGMNSTILNGATVGEESIVGAGTLIPGKMEIPPRSIVMGVPAKIVKENQESNRDACLRNAKAYHKLRDEFIAGAHTRYRVP